MTRFVGILLCLLCAGGVNAQVAAADTDMADFPFSGEQALRIIAQGPWPKTVPADPGNELSGVPSAEVIGQLLFNDTGLSGNGKLSCASCHHSELGFSDGLSVARGVGQHVRNTQGLLNVGLQRWFGWDGGADSLWAASIRPLLSPIEMNGETGAVARYLRATPVYESYLVGSDPVGDEALLVLATKAIAAYMRTLVSGTTAFDRFRDAIVQKDIAALNDYPEAALRGAELFFGQGNCFVCHFGANFSNGEFHDIGRPFFTAVGQVDPGRYTGIKRVREDPFNLLGVYNTAGSDVARITRSVTLSQPNFGQWRTPSLRNLTLTAPYMHDGSLATLRDVVDAYADIDPARLHAKGESLLNPLALSDSQRNDLVTFLRTLSVDK